MLRRKKDTIIDGKPLIELPPRELEIITCTFSAKEQQFYNDLAAKMDKTLDALMQTEGSKSYISVLLLLLRLRQGPCRFEDGKVTMLTVLYSLRSLCISFERLQGRHGCH